MDDDGTSEVISEPISAALLTLSRHRVLAKDFERVKAQCEAVDNWPMLINTAARKFSLTYVLRNLSQLYPDGEMERVLDMMRGSARNLQMASLKIISEQASFHDTCIRPLDIKHVYLKGQALAAMFHDDPGLRYCRDIDVLVSEGDLSRLLDVALGKGYRMVGNLTVPRFLESPRDIRANLRFSTVVTLVSPQGVPIEVHREVDKNLGVFEREYLLTNYSIINVGFAEMRSLSAEMMFCFACYHNTRHLWSRLHWLADLSAMLSSPALDLAKARGLADDLGLRSTIEACIEFDTLASEGVVKVRDNQGHGGELMQVCIQNLTGDLALERELRSNMQDQLVPFKWLLSRNARYRAKTRQFLKRFGPTFTQYVDWPLADEFQWLYYPSKPIYRAWKQLRHNSR